MYFKMNMYFEMNTCQSRVSFGTHKETIFRKKKEKERREHC